MSDFKQLQERIREFRDARDWMQFHNAKDMAAAIAIEAGELQELFLWKGREDLPTVLEAKRGAIQDELADIAVYVLEMADNLQIDLKTAILEKLEKNAAKYPIHLARGSSKKYTEL